MTALALSKALRRYLITSVFNQNAGEIRALSELTYVFICPHSAYSAGLERMILFSSVIFYGSCLSVTRVVFADLKRFNASETIGC